MKLNVVVERTVREAISAAVAQKSDRYDRAGLAMVDKGPEVAFESIRLGLAIGGAAISDLHEGERPNGEQLDRLAAALVETEAWAAIEKSDALEIMTAFVEKRPITVPIADVAVVIFALDAWLLSGFRPEERTWHQYLDMLLDTLEETADGPKGSVDPEGFGLGSGAMASSCWYCHTAFAFGHGGPPDEDGGEGVAGCSFKKLRQPKDRKLFFQFIAQEIFYAGFAVQATMGDWRFHYVMATWLWFVVVALAVVNYI